MDYVFLAIGCRFIALADNVDTFAGRNQLNPVKNLFNEWHAEDSGLKTKAVNTHASKRVNIWGRTLSMVTSKTQTISISL